MSNTYRHLRSNAAPRKSRARQLTAAQRRELDRISATSLAPVAGFILANSQKAGR